MLLYLRDASGKLISVRFQLVSTNAVTLSTTLSNVSMHEDVLMDDAAPLTENRKAGNFKTSNASINLTEGSFYRNVYFNMQETEGDKSLYSNIISVYKETEPLQKSAVLNIKPINLPTSLQSKALIVKIKNGNKIPVTSSFANDVVSGKIYSFGNYAIAVDETNPVISTINLEYDSVYNCRSVVVSTTDNLSGIKSHECFVNDVWTVSEYIQKENKIVCLIKDATLQKLSFKVIVEDSKGNSTQKEIKLSTEK